MAIKLLSLSSGSKGNCVIVATNTTAIIVDAGIAASKVANGLKRVGLNNPAVLITHTHCDHISHLASLTKRFEPKVFCHSDCFHQVHKKMIGGQVAVFESDFYVGDITVSPFYVSHDTPCFGYSFYHQGKKISILTDLGILDECVLDAISDSDLLFIEANHDEQMLKNNPNYPNVLKRRILSNRGHLSNRDCGMALVKLKSERLKRIVLGHLSQENNYPQLALDTVSGILKEAGINVGTDVHISAALYNTVCGIFEVE